MNTRTHLLRAAALALALALGACASHAPPPPGTVAIHLVALNDFHGNLDASTYTYTSVSDQKEHTITAGGIGTLGAALQAWRQEDHELLLVGAGDLMGASPPMSSMWADEPTIGAMNRLGLRVSSVGNHEFDGGRAELLRQMKGGCVSPRADKACKFEPTFGGAQFGYLAANVIDLTTNQPFLPAYRVEEVHGVKIGFIGAVLRDTASTSLASSIAGLRFDDEATSINRVLPALRKQGVGVFVVLIHEGGRTTDYFDQPDCSHLTGPIVGIVQHLDPAIRLVISGHTHKGYLCQVDGRVVTEAEMGGHVLSRIELTVDRASNTVREIRARNEIMVPGQYPPAPALDQYLAAVRGRSQARLAQPLAHVAVRAIRREKDDHVDESPLGDLVADALLMAGRPFGAQIAFQNNGGLRQDLETGPDKLVTAGEIQTVLPFANTMVVMNLTGGQIRMLLEQQWNGDYANSRGLLQVSEGFSYTWDPKQPEGHHVLPDSVMLNGVPLLDDSSYRVAINNFLAEGGDAFLMFISGKDRAMTEIRDIDFMSNYLVWRERQGKPAGTEHAAGRIQRVGGGGQG